MHQRSEEVSRELARMVAEACRSLFDAYGVELTPKDGTETEAETGPFCGVVGFTGPTLRGAVLLAGSHGPFESSCPATGTIRDWVGELTNQLVGRLKARLVERGVDVAMSTPIVLRGEHFAPLPRATDLAPSVFSAPEGTVLVWIDVEANDGFAMKPLLEGAPATQGIEEFFF